MLGPALPTPASVHAPCAVLAALSKPSTYPNVAYLFNVHSPKQPKDLQLHTQGPADLM